MKKKSKKRTKLIKKIQITKIPEENIIYPLDNEEIKKVTKEIENEPEIFNYKPKYIKQNIKELDQDKYVNKNNNRYNIKGLLNN